MEAGSTLDFLSQRSAPDFSRSMTNLEEKIQFFVTHKGDIFFLNENDDNETQSIHYCPLNNCLFRSSHNLLSGEQGDKHDKETNQE